MRTATVTGAMEQADGRIACRGDEPAASGWISIHPVRHVGREARHLGAADGDAASVRVEPVHRFSISLDL